MQVSHLRVYEVLTGTAVSLVGVAREVHPRAALVASVGTCLKKVQQVGHHRQNALLVIMLALFLCLCWH